MDSDDHGELRDEYDLTKLKRVGRGVYAERFRRGNNLILLDPDLAPYFPDGKTVNDALRLIVQERKSLQQS
jgi:hypothetical protein